MLREVYAYIIREPYRLKMSPSRRSCVLEGKGDQALLATTAFGTAEKDCDIDHIRLVVGLEPTTLGAPDEPWRCGNRVGGP